MPKKSPKKFKNTKKLKVRSVSKQGAKNITFHRLREKKKIVEKKDIVLEKKTVLSTQPKPLSNVDTSKKLDIQKTLTVLSKKQVEESPNTKKGSKLIFIFIFVIIVLGGMIFISTKINWSQLIGSFKKPATKLETSSSKRTVTWEEFEKRPEGNSNNENQNNSNGTDSSNNSNNTDESSNTETDNGTESPYTSAIVTEIKNTLSSIQGEIDNLDVENLAQPATYEF